MAHHNTRGPEPTPEEAKAEAVRSLTRRIAGGPSMNKCMKHIHNAGADGVTRQAIGEALGIAMGTVGPIVSALLHRGIVKVLEKPEGEGRGYRGKLVALVHINGRRTERYRGNKWECKYKMLLEWCRANGYNPPHNYLFSD